MRELLRRRVVRWLLVALLLVLAWLAATAYLFVWPPTDSIGPADAVVVLGSRSRPERLPEGLRLMHEHIAPVLVLMTPPAGPLCHRKARFEIICLNPKPFSTRGEARGVARLAERHGWHSLAVVTSRWHVTRARVLLRRCYHGSLRLAGANPSDNAVEYGEDVAQEWAGLLYALTLARGC